MITAPENVTILLGVTTSVVFTCSMSGMPNAPIISWQYVQPFTSPVSAPSTIVPSQQYQIGVTVNGSVTNSQLTITNVAFSNTGLYLCIGGSSPNLPSTQVQATLAVFGESSVAIVDQTYQSLSFLHSQSNHCIGWYTTRTSNRIRRQSHIGV